MSDPSQAIRIFISSPGDVTEERDGAKSVIETMQKSYLNALLRPVMWEELALPATASFQETIDLILEQEPIDVAVFIVWSRLGSPLGPAITKPDGSSYLSGTEREFDLMLAAHEQSGRKRPVILAYVRDDYEAFTRKLNELPETELSEVIKQRKLAESFIAERFHDAQGRNLRAYQKYKEPIGFIQRLRVHLRRTIDGLLEVESVAWTEEPYRALQAFDIEHAPIYYGREEETFDLLQRLRDQQHAKHGFVVLVGASGSGKSSLARAGVAANLVQHADSDGIHWRVAVFIPSLAGQSLHHGLVRSLSDFLPELVDSAAKVDLIAKQVADNPELMADLTVNSADTSVRLLLILDQMEELWTDQNISENDRESFLTAIKALAESGHVAVLASLRSDFYHHAQASPTFLSLKDERGHYDLRAPDAASVQRLITEPARLSGLRFEYNDKTGRYLNDIILQDAAVDANALPLLQYTLSELYRKRDRDQGVLTYRAYVELGGVEGAIGKRAEETFAGLPKDAQSALDEILPLLISVDVAGEQSAVRRRASVSELTSNPSRNELTAQLIANRFLTTDREGETPIASLAHEALLRCWFRISDWIICNRGLLRLRARVESLQQRWEQQSGDESLLLAEGLPLDEGLELLQKASHLLTDPTKHYIRASIEFHDRSHKQSRRRKTAVLSTIVVLLGVMIVGGVYLRRSTNASRLVQGLLQAKTSEVPEILAELSSYQVLAQGDLVTGFTHAEDDTDAKLHAALALIGRHDAAMPYVKERLLRVSAPQFSTVRDELYSQRKHLIDDYLGIAKDSGHAEARRFQADCALATYAPENEIWRDKAFTEWVADYLVGVPSSELLPWRDALREVREPLVEPLTVIFRNDTHDVVERRAAADILSDYLSENADRLFDLLVDASEKQFDPIFNKLIKHRKLAIELGNEAITKSIPASSSDADNETHAMRQANAAVMLLRMDAADLVWPLLRQRQDPRLRNYVIHWLSSRGGDADTLMARLKLESDVTIRRALLLSLGEFDLMTLKKQSEIKTVVEAYKNDPDAGLHSAAEWVLKKWNQDSELGQINANLPRLSVSESQSRPSKKWYIGADGSTFVMVSGGDFRMFSLDEFGNPTNEKDLVSVAPFEISTKEVTCEQYARFAKDTEFNGIDRSAVDPTQSPDMPKCGITWYDACAYCNWLSLKNGIPSDQWCYQPSPDNDLLYDEKMSLRPGWENLEGYRLPAQKEWEFACRAGSETDYHCGSSGLLPEYACFQPNSLGSTQPVGFRKPNDLGLFDMAGNAQELCQDLYVDFDNDGSLELVLEGLVGTSPLAATRGGFYDDRAKSLKSSSFDRSSIGERKSWVGFRVARSGR